MSSEDEMLTLAKAAKAIGLSPRLLRRAAQRGRLKTTLIETEFGPVYKTTLRDVEEWRKSIKWGKPSKKS